MKTPKQIHEQAMRLFHYAILNVSDTEVLDKRMELIYNLRNRYIDNIYRHNGFTTDGNGIATYGNTDAINDVWHNALTDKTIYAK